MCAALRHPWAPGPPHTARPLPPPPSAGLLPRPPPRPSAIDTFPSHSCVFTQTFTNSRITSRFTHPLLPFALSRTRLGSPLGKEGSRASQTFPTGLSTFLSITSPELGHAATLVHLFFSCSPLPWRPHPRPRAGDCPSTRGASSRPPARPSSASRPPRTRAAPTSSASLSSPPFPRFSIGGTHLRGGATAST